jgi:hypothetical protein
VDGANNSRLIRKDGKGRFEKNSRTTNRTRTKRQTQAIMALGFNLQLIGSQRYVLSKLDSLNKEQLVQLKTAFAATKHPRFKREVASSRHD